MAGKYLDYDGLRYLWGKLKAYVSGLFNGDITIGGKLSIKNGQSGAQIQSLGSGTYVYLELNGGVKVLRLVSNSNGNIGLYDPATSKWIIRADSNGNVHIDPDAELAGNIVTDGYLTLRTNNKAISLADADGVVRSMIYISSNNYFGLGYGMYNANIGETRIYGHAMRLYSHNPITTNQDMEIGGSLTVDGHSSAIGDLKTSYMTSAKTLAASTATALCSITLGAGTWEVVGYVRFPANSSGVRRINISTTSGDTILQQQTEGCSYVQQMQVVYVNKFSSDTTLYLNAYHSSSATGGLQLDAGNSSGYINGIRAIRIA